MQIEASGGDRIKPNSYYCSAPADRHSEKGEEGSHEWRRNERHAIEWDKGRHLLVRLIELSINRTFN
jgi:hypothetical protein